jgi:SAM-dependent methyltransferase
LPPFIRKSWLHEMSGEFDLVMLHHTLEHMPHQQEALTQVAGLLRSGGMCLVRIPVLPNEAWNRYRENWVQLDAPRHLYIHTPDSLCRVAVRAGLTLECTEFDSTELQFTGSELYARDRPLSQLNGAFSDRELRTYRAEAARLNAAGRGDQAAFYFRKEDATPLSDERRHRG